MTFTSSEGLYRSGPSSSISAAEANAVAASRTIRLDQPIQNVVSGSNRHKYFKRPIIPFMSAQPPEVLFATTRDGESALDAPAAEPEPLARDAGCQSDMRESDTQTDPYTPDYVVPAGTEPEVLGLAALKWGQGLPAGLHEVQMIERARAKRAFEAALPPMTDEASLALRRKMMSEQELRDWNVREGEIFANLVRGARPPIAPPASAAGDPSALRPPTSHPSSPVLPPPPSSLRVTLASRGAARRTRRRRSSTRRCARGRRRGSSTGTSASSTRGSSSSPRRTARFLRSSGGESRRCASCRRRGRRWRAAASRATW